MEILKGFAFDLQRHTAKELDVTNVVNLTGSTSTNKYYLINGATATLIASGGSVTISSTETAVGDLKAGNYYLRVNYADPTYTVTVVEGSAPTTDLAATTVKLNVPELNFTSTISTSALSVTAADVNITKLTGTTTQGGSITYGGLTYDSTKTSSAKMLLTGVANTDTVLEGSITLANNASVLVNGKIITPTTGTVVVSSDYSVSGLSKGTVFTTGTTNFNTYTVDVNNGLFIDMAETGTAVDAAVYYFTRALSSSTSIKISDSVTKADEISDSGKVQTIDATIGTASPTNPAAGFAAVGFVDSKNMYVYVKNGVSYVAGYADSSLGDQVGVLTLNSDGESYSYNGSSATSNLTLSDTGAGGKDITNVVGTGKDDTISFTNAAATIDGGAGKDTITIKGHSNTSVVGGAGDDTIAVNDPTAATTNVFIGGGDGKDSIYAAAAFTVGVPSGWTVDGGAGDDDIDFATKAATGINWSINGGDGNDKINVAAGITYSTINAGSGNDTIISNHASNQVSGGAGADIFDISGATAVANITDYAYGEDFIKVDQNTTEAALIGQATVVASTAGRLTADGLIDWKGTGAGTANTATVTSSAGYYAVNLVDSSDAKNKIDLAWVKEDATTIDASSISRKVVISGKTNTEGDLLIGGSKADTIYAGKNDSVYGGAGNDNLILGGNTGVYVGVAAASGTDTVSGFVAGFDIDTADAIYLVDGSVEDATFTNGGGTTATIKSGKGSLVLDGLTAGTQKFLVGDKKVYSIAKNQTLALSDSDDFANYFYGTEGSAISLANYQDDISVDLSNSMFKNISTITGGKGSTTLIGSAKGDSLVGGDGTSSLYGGAGKDTLKSGNGKTEFFLASGSGKDIVQGFVVGTDEDKSDVVNIFGASLQSVKRSANDVFTMKVSDADSLQVTQATSGVDQKIQWASGEVKGVAKIGYSGQANSFTYDSEVTNYLGGSKNDTVSYGSSSDDLEVWLEKETAYSSIETFDASSRSGSVLIAGTAASETIKGGTGDNSLWGGVGNQKDVLIGSTTGTNIFFYGMGNGSDSISGSSKDTVNMFDIQLSDLTGADIDTSNRRVIISTTAGDKVTVSGGVQDFVVGGVTYTTSYSGKNDWKVKE